VDDNALKKGSRKQIAPGHSGRCIACEELGGVHGRPRRHRDSCYAILVGNLGAAYAPTKSYEEILFRMPLKNEEERGTALKCGEQLRGVTSFL